MKLKKKKISQDDPGVFILFVEGGPKVKLMQIGQTYPWIRREMKDAPKQR